MKMLLAALALNATLFTNEALAQFAEVLPPPAPTEACKKPKPLYGRIVALCGDHMITFVGTEKRDLLGVKTSRTVFELAYCETGGPRTELLLKTNSEGFELVSSLENSIANFLVYDAWREFKLIGTDYDGKPLNVRCSEYDDKRKDIEYIY